MALRRNGSCSHIVAALTAHHPRVLFLILATLAALTAGNAQPIHSHFSRYGRRPFSLANTSKAFSVQFNLPAGLVNSPYTGSISASGGVGPYSFVLTSGSLPSGLALSNALGSVTGTPTLAGTSNFKLTISDSTGASFRTHGQIVINSLTTTSTPLVTVVVSPSSTTLTSGGTQQFSAAIQGTSNTAVSWSASAGSISTSGLFTAPAVSSTTSVNVTATSAASPSSQSTATVSVNPPAPISVAVSPGSASVASGGTQLFTAAVQGTSNSGVAWKANTGTISTDGYFTAPVTSSNTTAVVTATSLADTTQSASATVSVIASTPTPTSTGTSTGPCLPPTYCASTSTAVVGYGEAGLVVPPAPALNGSYTDPAFNRKIWRWTDGTTAASPCAGHSMGLTWDAGNFSGSWNQASDALLTGADCGAFTALKLNLSNPSAPTASPWSCTDSTTGLCQGGQIVIGNNPHFANTSDYLIFYTSNQGVLSKADFTANYSNPAAAPVVTSPWFDPWASGHCASSLGRPNGGTEPLVTSDDSYFTGFGQPSGQPANHVIVWHAGDANCTLLDFSTANWTVSGVGQQGGSTGTFTWTDESGNPTTSPGTGCILHGEWYDQVTNSIVITLQSSSCSGLDSQNHGVIANLTTLKAFVCTQNECAGGHGLGQIVTIGTSSYICNGALPNANTAHEFCNSFSLPSTSNSWYDFPAGFNGGPWPGDYHMGGLWTGGFPFYKVGSATGLNVAPPSSTLATIILPFNEELDVFVAGAAASPSTSTMYRYVHLYEADKNYNTTGSYSSLVGPALAPNKCWAVFPSNWYGNLGTSGARSTACTSSTTGQCAHDVFAVYLCGGPGT